MTVRLTSSLPLTLSVLSTSAARLRTGICRWPRASTRGGSTASVPMTSSVLSTARRMARGPARILRSSAPIARGEVKRRRPSTAALARPTASTSRNRATNSQ